jgi:hypothetical protein
MVDRAGHLEDDPGVAPLLPPRARLARSPTLALVAAAMLAGAVVWRRSRTSSSPSSRSTRRVYAGSTVWDRNACRWPASTDVALHGPSPNATASPSVGGDRDGRYRAGQSLLRRYLRTRLRRCGVRRPSRRRSRRGRFRSRARCRPVPRPSSCDPRRLLMALDPKSRNTAVLAAAALAVLATVVAVLMAPEDRAAHLDT